MLQRLRAWLDGRQWPAAVIAKETAALAEPTARWEGEGGRFEPVREPRPDPVLVLAGINPGAAGATTAGE